MVKGMWGGMRNYVNSIVSITVGGKKGDKAHRKRASGSKLRGELAQDQLPAFDKKIQKESS